MENVKHGSRAADQDLSTEHYKYKASLLSTQTRRSQIWPVSPSQGGLFQGTTSSYF
jgi:hypothetical protein